MRSASVVSIGLNVTNQSNGHLAIISRSEFRSCAAEIGFSTIMKIPESSAKSLMLDPIFFTYHLYMTFFCNGMYTVCSYDTPQ